MPPSMLSQLALGGGRFINAVAELPGTMIQSIRSESREHLCVGSILEVKIFQLTFKIKDADDSVSRPGFASQAVPNI